MRNWYGARLINYVHGAADEVLIIKSKIHRDFNAMIKAWVDLILLQSMDGTISVVQFQ